MTPDRDRFLRERALGFVQQAMGCMYEMPDIEHLTMELPETADDVATYPTP